MNIYIIYAKTFQNKYYESVEVLEGMEEKKSTIVGHKRKIKKETIGKINAGNFIGAFNIILTDKEDVQDARERLNKHLHQFNLEKIKEAQEAIDTIKNHNLDEQIKFK